MCTYWGSLSGVLSTYSCSSSHLSLMPHTPNPEILFSKNVGGEKKWVFSRKKGQKNVILGHFWSNSSPNIFTSTYRMKKLKVWKVFKIFQTFRKFWKKGLLAPRTHPNPQMKFLEKKWKFSIFFKNLICGFGCVLGAKSPFFQNFRKLQKILNTLHTFSIFIR